MKFTSLATAYILSICVIAPAYGQSTAVQIPCAESHLLLDFDAKCYRRVPTGVALDNRFASTFYGLVATPGSHYLNITLLEAAHGSIWLPYTTEQAVTNVKGFNREIRNGSGFSEPRSKGSTTIFSFAGDGQRACLAFDHAGPYRGSGLAWMLRGHACSTSGQQLDDTVIYALLESVQIGSGSERKNAYGESPRPPRL